MATGTVAGQCKYAYNATMWLVDGFQWSFAAGRMNVKGRSCVDRRSVYSMR